MAIAPQNIMTKLRSMPDAQLAQYAAMHKNDPFIFPLAFQESQTRKQVRGAQQAQVAEQQKVADQALASMGAAEPMPEDVGIAQLGAPNMENFADGGIVAFAGGGTPFAQWLAERGSSMQAYAQMSPAEQQNLRNLFRSPGPTMPAVATTATAAEAAVPVAAEAATTGRAYQAGRMLGKGLAKTGPAIAAGEVLGNLGSYKFQEPDLDTSAGGVYDALKAGKYSQAGRNLVMGLPEAGYDLLRSGAGLGDYLLPGQPLAEGVDKGVKYLHGDNITTPSDATRAEEAAKKAVDAQKAAAADNAKKKEDFKVTSTEPTGNIMGSRRTPLQLAEAAEKEKAAAKDRAGIANLMKMPSAGKTPAAEKGLGSIAEFAKEANDYAGVDPTAKQLARIEAQEAKTGSDKSDALNMALLKAGLGMMAGTSQHAFENIGKGAMGGLEDYAGTMKELKKAALERDKMRDAAEQAAYAYKRDDVKGYRDAKEKEANRAAELQRTQMSIAGQLQAAGIGRAATLEAARMPGAQERLYAALSNPNSDVAKGFKAYAAEMGPEAKAAPALVAQYAKNPMALEMLKTTDPMLYASIKQQMLSMSMPQVQTAPTGEIRR